MSDDNKDMVDCEKCSNNPKNGGKCGIDGFIFYACNKVISPMSELYQWYSGKNITEGDKS